MFQNRIYNIFYFQDNIEENDILSDIHDDLTFDAQCYFYIFLFICLGIGVGIVAFRNRL
jgi:hypothetical protein